MSQLKAKSILIELGLINVSKYISFNFNNENMIANKLTLYIKNNNIILTRGDIINTVIEEDRFENDGKFIWNGNSVDILNYDNNYGIIPYNYIVDDNNFAPDYWSGEIYNNCVFHPDKKYRIEVCETLKLSNEFTENIMWYGYFLRSGVKHFVFYDFINKNKEKYRSKVKELFMKKPFDIYGNDRYEFNINFKYNYGKRGYFLIN